jgi:hypothetical protein
VIPSRDTPEYIQYQNTQGLADSGGDINTPAGSGDLLPGMEQADKMIINARQVPETRTGSLLTELLIQYKIDAAFSQIL